MKNANRILLPPVNFSRQESLPVKLIGERMGEHSRLIHPGIGEYEYESLGLRSEPINPIQPLKIIGERRIHGLHDVPIIL